MVNLNCQLGWVRNPDAVKHSFGFPCEGFPKEIKGDEPDTSQ